MSEKLNKTTEAEIVRMTGIIAEKLGYNLNDNFVAPHAVTDKLPKEKSSLVQFSLEMNAFIDDNIQDFINKGLTEEDAVIATQQKFSGPGFTTSLNEFFNKYGGIKEMEKPTMNRNHLLPKNEQKIIIPMLYLAFALIGLGFGAMVGKIVGMLLIGIVCGLIIGIGLGIVTHAVVLLEEGRK